MCYTVRDAVDWCGFPTTRWFWKGSNHSPLHFCRSVKYRQTVDVEQGYKSKVHCGCSITCLPLEGFVMVISVGIDVSKDKHDCFIQSSEGEVLSDVSTIPNNMEGFHCLLLRIQDCTNSQDKIKVGLEATGHYSCNLLGVSSR